MKKTRNKTNKYKSCSECFRSHKGENCKFKSATCNKCGKRGHISPVWMTANTNNNNSKWKKNRNTEQKNNIDVIDTTFEGTGEVTNNDSKSYMLIQIFNNIVKFQISNGKRTIY